jgi:hypothetical protein
MRNRHGRGKPRDECLDSTCLLVDTPNNRFERSRGGMLFGDAARPYGANLKVVLRRGGVVGGSRRESMIWINLLRLTK